MQFDYFEWFPATLHAEVHTHNLRQTRNVSLSLSQSPVSAQGQTQGHSATKMINGATKSGLK